MISSLFFLFACLSVTVTHWHTRGNDFPMECYYYYLFRCEQKNGKKGKQQISETLLCLCAMKIPFGYFLDFGFPAGSFDVRNCGRSECAMERHHIQLYRSQSILLIGSIARSCFSCLNFFRSVVCFFYTVFRSLGRCVAAFMGVLRRPRIFTIFCVMYAECIHINYN